MHKKNLIKLLPAVAVIIAVAAAGFQQDSEIKSAKTVQASESKLVKSSELESLLTAAYFNNGETDNADSSILKTKKSKSKIKKTGITTGKTKQLPDRGRVRPQHLPLPYRKVVIKMVLIREVVQDLAEQSLWKLQSQVERSHPSRY